MGFKWVPNYDPSIIFTNQLTLKYPKTTLKYPLNIKNDQNTPKTQKKKDQNNPKTYEMTKIPLESKK